MLQVAPTELLDIINSSCYKQHAPTELILRNWQVLIFVILKFDKILE